ncbi:uDENN domain protein, partial [Trichuris suis]
LQFISAATVCPSAAVCLFSFFPRCNDAPSQCAISCASLSLQMPPITRLAYAEPMTCFLALLREPVLLSHFLTNDELSVLSDSRELQKYWKKLTLINLECYSASTALPDPSTMNEKRMDLCPRLIDYLVIVGSRDMVIHPTSGEERLESPVALDAHGKFSRQMSTNRSELLRRYPSCSHEDFVLPSDVVSFCQPDSCTVSSSPVPNMRHTTSFIFALTEKDSAKIRYGVSLNFLQRLSLRGQSSSQEHVKTKRQKVHRRIYSLVSLCIISHHPFFTKFRQLLYVLRRLINCSNERIRCSSNAVSSQFGDGVWEALLGVWLENISNAVMKEICELETWILKLLSAPVPAPGFTKLQVGCC